MKRSHLQISSLVALRDRDGLPGASNLPYFFLPELLTDPFDVSKFKMLLLDEEVCVKYTY